MTAPPSTTYIFETVANIITDMGDVSRDQIKMESDLVNDLEIDSLNFLDITFAIDKAFGIKVPIETWVNDVNSGDVLSDEYFIMQNLCARIAELVVEGKS